MTEPFPATPIVTRAAAFLARVAAACVALAAIAGSITGCAALDPRAGTQQSASAAASSGSGKSPPCPARPVAGPPHTLTFPQSVDGYQIATGPSTSTALVFIGQNGCNLAEQDAGYQNSQGSFVGIEVGLHANLWHSFNAMWGFYFGASGDKIVPVPAGPLGGLAGCGTDSMGTSCNWLDNDTYGIFLGNGPSMSQAQTASLMLVFRNAIEQPG
jgi:hypothetical protein